MSSLKSKIESLLFITNGSFTVKKIITLTKSEKSKVEIAIKELMDEYNNNDSDRGMSIQKIEDKIQMVTSPDNAKVIKDFLKEEITGELSRPALETLTIVAYRGPIAKADIEQIRGVNCSVILRNLLIRGLVETKEDKKNMTTVYNITMDFLRHLGVNEQSELPDYGKLNSDESINKILTPEPTSDTPTEEPIQDKEAQK